MRCGGTGRTCRKPAPWRARRFTGVARRQRAQLEAFQHDYARRAGVEDVHAQGVRRMGRRRSRRIGEPRTHRQQVVTATAMNVCSLYEWGEDTAPHLTPLSRFARFMKEVA